MAIEAMTGTGKTAFVLGPMLKWCVDECHRTYGMRFKKILYLCNRAPLREELVDALNKAGVPNTRVDGYDVVTLMVWDDDAQEYSVMKVSTYQRYEEFLAKDPVRARCEIQRFSCIVCDEAQYFFADASFNENTTLSYRTIMAARQRATVIAMTATPENMFTSWMKKGLLAKNRYYYLPQKMSHIRKALIYSNDLEREKLLNQIPEALLMRWISARSIIVRQAKNSWQKSENGTNYDLDTVEAWLDYKHGKPEKWNGILAQRDAQERIEHCKAITYIHAEGTYQLNPMLVNNMRQMRDLLDALHDHGYRATMQERVWAKTLQVSPREYRDEVITHYIIDNFGKEMSKQELLVGLAEAGLYKPGKRPIGQSILNGKLKKYHVQIGTIAKKCRVNGKSTTLTYWLLVQDHH